MGLFSHCKDVYKQKDYWKSDVCCHHSHLDWATIVVGNGRQVTHCTYGSTEEDEARGGTGHVSSLQMGVRTGLRRLF